MLEKSARRRARTCRSGQIRASRKGPMEHSEAHPVDRDPKPGSSFSRVSSCLAGVVFGVVFAAAVAIFFVVARDRASREKETYDHIAVIQAVRRILKATTVQMQVADVVTYRDQKSVLYFFSSEKNAILRVHGKVEAGFDLANGNLAVTADSSKKIVKIRLPHARVAAMDPMVEILDERAGWLNPVKNEDRNLWFRWAHASLKRAALTSGITGEAEKNATQLLSAFVEGYGYHAEITYEGPPEAPVSSSSAAGPPG